MPITKWITLSGVVDIDADKLTYRPTKFKDRNGGAQILHAYAKTDVQFLSGKLTFKLAIRDTMAQCQLILGYDTGDMVFVGLQNHPSGAFGASRWDKGNQKLEPLFATGVHSSLQVGAEYQIDVVVTGSNLELYVNDILIGSTLVNLTPSQIVFFFNSKKEIEVSSVTVEEKQSKAFIVMQFTEEYNQLYQEVIKPVAEEFNLVVERADDKLTSTPILQDIIKSIKESAVIIADITPDNPNVFYEIGYAHAIEKPTILLSDKKREKLPFDVSGFRTLFYDNTIAGKTSVEKNLRGYLRSIFPLSQL